MLPDRVRCWSVERIAAVTFACSRTYRRNAISNLRLVLEPCAPDDQVIATARAAFRTSAHNIVDLFRLGAVSSDHLAQRVRLEHGDWTIFERERVCGHGVIVMTGHIGAFDVLGHLLVGLGHPLTAMVGRTLPPPLYVAAVMLRGAHGMSVVDASPSGFRAMLAALHAGECVGFVGDRDFSANGAPVTFFGKRTTLPSGAVRAARATGAPIIAAYARRTTNGCYTLRIDEPIRIQRTADRAADISGGMEQVVASLTRAIAESPGEWTMFQPVWAHAIDGR